MNKLQKIKTACSHISLIDKFLLFFLFLFLVQIVYGLFSASESSVLSNSVDIIIRTYASAVFGYFLSGRFSGPSSINVTAVTSPIMTPNPPSAPSSVRNKIGFSDLPAAKAASADTALRTLSAPAANHTFQTIIVASVGIISLIVLLILRNTSSITEAMVAPLTQLRDMLSSSIGFLVGNKSQNNAAQ